MSERRHSQILWSDNIDIPKTYDNFEPSDGAVYLAHWLIDIIFQLYLFKGTDRQLALWSAPRLFKRNICTVLYDWLIDGWKRMEKKNIHAAMWWSGGLPSGMQSKNIVVLSTSELIENLSKYWLITCRSSLRPLGRVSCTFILTSCV